jgi:hypothetical protein
MLISGLTSGIAPLEIISEIISEIVLSSGGGFEGKSNDIVYSDIVYSDIVYSDNAEYNYGSLSELYNNIDLSQYLASDTIFHNNSDLFLT